MTETPQLDGVGGNSRGLNMQLYSGKPFYPTDPRPEEVNVYDIAHALALQCRYNGHCRSFYSVAEHAVLVSRIVEKGMDIPCIRDELEKCSVGWNLIDLAFEAEHHDDEEAYSGDLIRPFKYQIPGWEGWVRPIRRAICLHFGIPEVEHKVVKVADFLALAIEKRDIMNPPLGVDWGRMPEPPKGFEVKGLSWQEAEEAYLDRHFELLALRKGNKA